MQYLRSSPSLIRPYFQRIIDFRWLPYLFALAFTLIFFWLINRQYITFQLRGADIDRYYQAIWNTLRGQFLYTTITEESLLGDHFTPYMALLSPLVQIWPDPRILFFVQLIGIAITGLILYKLVADKYRRIALLFLLAFYLNPALHQVTLIELRRVTLAMPFLALMLFGLIKERRGLMLVGMFFALLIKEDMGLIVAMAGFYLLVFKRDWRWGLPIFIVGIAWTVSMLMWVIPGIAGESYAQLGYFNSWGSSPAEMVVNIISNPVKAIQVMFDGDSLAALWRLILPMAIILPFLAADIVLVALPLVAMMLLSSEPAMHRLDRWYLAPVLPILFAAVAVALTRMPRRIAMWSAVALVGMTLLAYGLYSQAPFGGRFDISRYQQTQRNQNAWNAIAMIPDDATVVAQMAFITPLADREAIYLYPWYDRAQQDVDFFVLGRDLNAYPISTSDLNWEIRNLVADTDFVIDTEVDGIYVIRKGGLPTPARNINAVAEGAIKLEKAELAVADEHGYYQPNVDSNPSLVPGNSVRVTLYWEALGEVMGDRTVSVRIEDSEGFLIAQHDMQPGDGSRPTSWWEPGWYFRDVYYLTVAPEAAPGPATIDLVLYDSNTSKRIPFGEEEVLTLWELNLSR